MGEDTAALLAAVRDRDEIIQLVWRYGATIDAGDKEAWLALFADDATFSFRGGARVARGEAELRVLLDEALEVREHGAISHVASNVVVDLDPDDPDRASGRTTSIGYFTDVAGKVTARGGHYDEHFVRTPGGWRFAGRSHVVDWCYAAV